MHAFDCTTGGCVKAVERIFARELDLFAGRFGFVRLGRNGLVVELDLDAFHHAFAELLTDPARARALGGGTTETEPKPSMAVSWKPGKPSSI